MNYRKGMSQTLALIVAASVLMMTALTVIFMTQGSLQDVFSGSNEQSCISTVKSKCSIATGNPPRIDLPESCARAGLDSGTIADGYQVSGDEVICSTG